MYRGCISKLQIINLRYTVRCIEARADNLENESRLAHENMSNPCAVMPTNVRDASDVTKNSISIIKF